MRRPTLAALMLTVVALAACANEGEGAGGGGAGGGSPTATAAVSPSPSPTGEQGGGAYPRATDEASGSGETEVEAEDSALGTILTDADGNTLYVFLADEGGESTCYDECADSWPALIARGEPKAGNGVDASLLGTTERTDGELQVTYAGQPLYYFAGDSRPGDTNGQGVGDVWYVVSPDGEPIQA
jgi:predicted lipoprotein with Yx(FWY)xxD motif